MGSWNAIACYPKVRRLGISGYGRRYAHLPSEHLPDYVDRLSALQVVDPELKGYDLITANKL
jgi:hypothetical protein